MKLYAICMKISKIQRLRFYERSSFHENVNASSQIATNGNPNSAMIFHFVGGMLVFLKTLTKDWASFFGLPKELGEIFIGVC